MEKKKLNKKQRKAIILSVIAVVIVAVICIIAFRPEEKLSVETVNVSKQTISETLDTTGKVSSTGQDVFMLPSGVELLTLNVKEGDIVEAGDVIATFDLSSLKEALAEKKSAYEKSKSAYDNAVEISKDSKGKINEVKNQIAALEKEIAALENKANADKNPTTITPTQKPSTDSGVKVSDSLVKRFMSVAKIFGVEYEKEDAKKLLTNLLSAGSSLTDISSMMDNLGILAGSSGSFDMSALSSMTSSSELMNAEMSLIQLKAQLATLELQSDGTYLSAFKTIAEKSEEAYLATLSQVENMQNGWIAKNRGIVSEVNLSTDPQQENSTAVADFDVSSILSALTSGAEVTDIVSSLMGGSNAAVKILYYPLVADISLTKYDILEVSRNQDVIIESASGKEFPGKVSYVSAVATSGNGLNINSIMGSGTAASSIIPAQITINGADESIIVGVDVQVSIITDTVEDAMVVPVEAICIDGEEVFVYVLEDDVAVKKTVELGISSDTHYQILSGLDFDDVLIKNTLGLEDGVAVQKK